MKDMQLSLAGISAARLLGLLRMSPMIENMASMHALVRWRLTSASIYTGAMDCFTEARH